MQAAMLSHSMLPPIHTWTGFRSLRSDVGEQGRRKPAKPTTHWFGRMQGQTSPDTVNTMADNQSSIKSQNVPACKVVYLRGEKSCGGDPNPAVQGVEVGNFFGIVEVKHGTQPHDWQDQGEEHQCSMQQLPGEFILTPGQGDTVHHSSCREEASTEKTLNLF